MSTRAHDVSVVNSTPFTAANIVLVNEENMIAILRWELV